MASRQKPQLAPIILFSRGFEMSVQKRKRELLKIARQVCSSATIKHTGGTHLVVEIAGPNGSRGVFCSCTSSDFRDTKNFKRDLMKVAREVGLVANQNNPPASQ